MQNEKIKTFDLELEAECLKVAKPNSFEHMAKTSSRNTSRPKHKHLDYAFRQVRSS